MITAADTNILVDVLIDDKTFGKPSVQALRQCLNSGGVVICGVVFVETSILFPSPDDFLPVLSNLGIRIDTISMDAFLSAARIWKSYRNSGGQKDRVIADFLVGSHALIQCNQLLTRDRGFYRQYFKELKVVEPAATGAK